MKMLSFGAVLMSLIVIVPGRGAADAPTLGVVAVAEPPGPSPELAELTHQLRAVTAERTQGVLEASQVRDRMMGQPATSTLAELDRAYAGSLATYQNGDFAGAARTLRGVIEDLEKLPDGPETFSQWTRAMTRLARTEQTLGHRDQAHEIMEQLVRAAPGIKVDPNQYPPSFSKQIEEVHAQVKALPVHRLTVQATAKGVRVFVGGREVGGAPLVISLPRGRYRVSGSAGSLRVPSTTVDLSAENQTVTLDFAFAEALRPAGGPGLALPEKKQAKALITAGAYMGLDRLVAASFAKAGDVEYLVGTYYDVRKGMMLREGRVRLSNRSAPPGGLTALASFLVTGQQSSLVAATALPPASSVERSSAKPSLEVQPRAGADITPIAAVEKPSKILGWTAVGTGVIAVGFGAFAVVKGFSARGKYADARAMLEPDGTLSLSADPSRYNQLINEGDSARASSYGGTGVAVGAAALTGILGYLSYKQTGEVGPFRF